MKPGSFKLKPKAGKKQLVVGEKKKAPEEVAELHRKAQVEKTRARFQLMVENELSVSQGEISALKKKLALFKEERPKGFELLKFRVKRIHGRTQALWLWIVKRVRLVLLSPYTFLYPDDLKAFFKENTFKQLRQSRNTYTVRELKAMLGEAEEKNRQVSSFLEAFKRNPDALIQKIIKEKSVLKALGS